MIDVSGNQAEKPTLDLMLRQVTPGFDETTQTNVALLQMLGSDEPYHSNLELDTIVPLTLDEDSKMFAGTKSIHKINCTPVG